MIGWPEMIFILVILLFVFGPSKLPKIAQDLGKAWREFTNITSGITNDVQSRTDLKSKNNEDLILKLAEKLNIDSEGKSALQICEEINIKAQEKELVDQTIVED